MTATEIVAYKEKVEDTIASWQKEHQQVAAHARALRHAHAGRRAIPRARRSPHHGTHAPVARPSRAHAHRPQVFESHMEAQLEKQRANYERQLRGVASELEEKRSEAATLRSQLAMREGGEGAKGGGSKMCAIQ